MLPDEVHVKRMAAGNIDDPIAGPSVKRILPPQQSLGLVEYFVHLRWCHWRHMDATVGELASHRLVLCDQLLNGRRDADERERYSLRSERLHERRKARAIGDAIELVDNQQHPALRDSGVRDLLYGVVE